MHLQHYLIVYIYICTHASLDMLFFSLLHQDLDSYKQWVREDMAEWQAALKARNIPDWLIVVVIPDESKVKSKILPRSSVIDKVRSDFCSKQPDR